MLYSSCPDCPGRFTYILVLYYLVLLDSIVHLFLHTFNTSGPVDDVLTGTLAQAVEATFIDGAVILWAYLQLEGICTADPSHYCWSWLFYHLDMCASGTWYTLGHLEKVYCLTQGQNHQGGSLS